MGADGNIGYKGRSMPLNLALPKFVGEGVISYGGRKWSAGRLGGENQRSHWERGWVFPNIHKTAYWGKPVLLFSLEGLASNLPEAER